MSTQPTLDGLTMEQILDLCEETAVNAMQAETVGKGIVLPPIILSTMRMGALSGAKAMFDLLVDRGLIVERP